jgi:RNA polymerase sigma factor (sigma-70 family)
MITNPIQSIRDIWLVELLEKNAEGLTLQEIIDEYKRRPPQLGNNVNPSQVSERTIHNWFKEIEENFHIKISCGRGNKTYHIDNDDYWDNTTVKDSRILRDVWSRIVISDSQQYKKSGISRHGELFNCFMQVGNSMLNGESIAIRYGKKHPKISFNEPCIFKPFCIKVIENECYVIGEIRPVSGLWSERIEVYSLDRLSLFEGGYIPIENYTIPYDFTPSDYYNDNSIVKRRYRDKLMAVFFNANNDTADYLREHPIAPTQTEIESNRTLNKNIFMVVVKPNEDFFTQILSFGEELTITDPDFLKREGEDGENKKIFGFKRYNKDLIAYDYFSLSHLNYMKEKGIGVNKLLHSKYSGFTDDELVVKYQQGEEGGFEILFRRYNDKTLRYLQNLTADKYYAAHLNSITWEKVSVALLKEQYKDSEQFENWVKVIAKRTFVNWYEERKRTLPTASFDYDESVFEGVDEGPERVLEKKENTEVLKRLIEDLNPDLRRVLELDQKGYTYEDIAKIEGVPVSTIAQRYKRAVRAIQDMLF